VSTNPTCVKYKFGIQVPKGIKNAINLDKNNRNSLWQDAIRTKLKQLTDYQTFTVLDAGEDIPKGYQKIPYHIEFDVKYDLRHKARLVAGGNRTFNDIEDIYLGVVCTDTVRRFAWQKSDIDKSLYGVKTSAGRFHEHLAESLFRLEFKKTKHDPDKHDTDLRMMD
jgi:hypothetical protein